MFEFEYLLNSQFYTFSIHAIFKKEYSKPVHGFQLQLF